MKFSKMKTAGLWQNHPQTDIERLKKLEKIKYLLQDNLVVLSSSESSYQVINVINEKH